MISILEAESESWHEYNIISWEQFSKPKQLAEL